MAHAIQNGKKPQQPITAPRHLFPAISKDLQKAS